MINSYYINSYSLILIIFILFVSISFSPIFSLENTTNTTLNNTINNPLQIDITSHHTNMSIPIGNLTIYGISSDTSSSDCSVFASWGKEPFQIANPIGHGDNENYSTWSFTFNKSYHEIIIGNNTINAKISCEDQSNQKQISVLIIGQSSEIDTISNIKNQTTFNNSTNIQSTNILNRTIDYDYIRSTDTQIELSDNSKMLNVLNDQNITLNNITSTALNNMSNIIWTKLLSVNMSFPNIIFIEDIFQLFVKIYDSESSEPLPEALVIGNIQKIGESFMKPLKFAGDTNNNGTYSFNWKIIDNYELGNYTLSIIVQAPNYAEYSEVKNFIIQNTTSELLSDDTVLIDPANEETFEDIQQPSDSELLSDDTVLIDPANEETFEDIQPSDSELLSDDTVLIDPANEETFEDIQQPSDSELLSDDTVLIDPANEETFEDALPSTEEEEEIEEPNQLETFEDALPSTEEEEEEEIEEPNQLETFEDALPSTEPPFKLPSLFP